MLVRWLLVLLFSILACFPRFALASALMTTPVTWTVTVGPAVGPVRTLSVTLSLRGDEDGSTRLRVPSAWGGEDELWRHIQLSRVSGGRLTTGVDPSDWTIEHRPNAPLTIRYTVSSAHQEPARVRADNRGYDYRPRILEDQMTVIGTTVFVIPEREWTTPAQVNWRRLPAGWTLASDTQHADLELGDVVQSITLAGRDVRTLEQRNQGKRLRVAALGEFGRPDTELLARLTAVMEANNLFWGGVSNEYLVTLVSLGSLPNRRSSGGTGLGDAYAAWIVSDLPNGQLDWLIGHEHLHNWFPSRFGAMPEGASEARDYWFSEGFTDFYTNRILLRAGIWSPEQFIAEWQSTLTAYAVSPARSLNDVDLGNAFWRDPNAQRMPYQRGAILAAMLDAALPHQADGGSTLDAIMKSLLLDDGTQPDTLATTRLRTALLAAGGETLLARLESVVKAESPAVFPSDGWGTCLTVTTVEAAPFHRGFDIEATSANSLVVHGTIEGGPAWQAGLRDGMQIIRRTGGEIGNSTVALEYLVRDGDSERTLRWFPEGNGAKITRQTLTPGAGLDPANPMERERCRLLLAGQRTP